MYTLNALSADLPISDAEINEKVGYDLVGIFKVIKKELNIVKKQSSARWPRAPGFMYKPAFLQSFFLKRVLYSAVDYKRLMMNLIQLFVELSLRSIKQNHTFL